MLFRWYFKVKVMFYCHTARHTTPHTCVWRRHRTHTHTHADEVAGEICLLPLTHPGVLVLPQGSQEQWAAFFFFGARGPGQVFSPILVRDGQGAIFSVLLHVFVLGFYVEETLVNTGRTCKLHTERPGR